MRLDLRNSDSGGCESLCGGGGGGRKGTYQFLQRSRRQGLRILCRSLEIQRLCMALRACLLRRRA